MIIRHSLKILEQLTEIETHIQVIERLIDDEKIPIEREKLLWGILKCRELERSREKKRDD
jgi:hypothetical protein